MQSFLLRSFDYLSKDYDQFEITYTKVGVNITQIHFLKIKLPAAALTGGSIDHPDDVSSFDILGLSR